MTTIWQALWAVTAAAVLAAAGCASSSVRERSGLVYTDLPAPVRAAFEKDHQTATYEGNERHQAMVGLIAERTTTAGDRTYLVNYTTAEGKDHSVEYNVGGDEINSK